VRADVLVLSPSADVKAVGELIAPVPILKDPNGQSYVECVVLELQRFGEAEPPAIKIVAFSPSRQQRSKPVRIPVTAGDVMHEIDTLVDLKTYFGSFGKTTRVGSRRYVRAFLKHYREFRELEFDPSDGIYDGTLLTCVTKQQNERGMGRVEFEAAMKAWTGGGGLYREAPFARQTGHPLGIQIRDIVAKIALERRCRYLEPGFEPAAVAMVSALIAAEPAADGPYRKTQLSLRAGFLSQLAGMTGSAGPRSVADSDPPEVRDLARQLIDSTNDEKREELRGRLRAELAKHTTAKDGVRARWAEQWTALDPSELTNVWMDVHANSPLLRPGGAASDPIEQRAVLHLISNLAAMTARPADPNPRRHDRIPLWPRVPEITTRLFGRNASAPWTKQGRKRQAELWRQILVKGNLDPSASKRSATLMATAHWGPPDEIDAKAKELLRQLQQRAQYVLSARNRLASATDADRERLTRSLARAEREFAGALALAHRMSAVEPEGPTDPPLALRKQKEELDKWVQEIRAGKQPGDALTPVELVVEGLR